LSHKIANEWETRSNKNDPDDTHDTLTSFTNLQSLQLIGGGTLRQDVVGIDFQIANGHLNDLPWVSVHEVSASSGEGHFVF
jgi:hypothetical protein